MKKWMLAGFGLLMGQALAADTVFICTGTDDRKTWSNIECPPGQQAERREIEVNVLPSDGLRAWASRSPPLPDHDARIEAERRDALRHAEKQEQGIRCENARRDYSFESTWKSHRAKPKQKYAIMQRECAGLGKE